MRNCGKKWSAGVGVLLLGMLITVPSPARSQTAQDYFVAGTQAARQDDHLTALQQFNKALAAGMQTAALYYNIGVTHYRLGYLNQAASAFKRAAHSPKMAGLAYYNLGLIALDQNNRTRADEYFRKAEQAAQTERLRKLSRYARDAMSLETTEQDQAMAAENNMLDIGQGLLWVELSAGYDDNVLLVQPEETGASNEEDTLAGIMLFGHYYGAGNRHHGLRLYGLALLHRHSRLDTFDLGIKGAGADYVVTTGQWRHNLDMMRLQTSLGEDELEDVSRLTLSSTVMLTDNLQLKFQLGYESIDASPTYSFLDGKRQTGSAAFSETAGDWELEYNLELNDREDYLSTDGEFQSFSPKRQELAYVKQIGFGKSLMLETEAAYTRSRYRDENIQPDGTRQTREDEHPSLAIRLYRTWMNNWRLGAELRYTENESNVDQYDYSRHAFTLTLDKAFRF